MFLGQGSDPFLVFRPHPVDPLQVFPPAVFVLEEHMTDVATGRGRRPVVFRSQVSLQRFRRGEDFAAARAGAGPFHAQLPAPALVQYLADLVPVEPVQGYQAERASWEPRGR